MAEAFLQKILAVDVPRPWCWWWGGPCVVMVWSYKLCQIFVALCSMVVTWYLAVYVKNLGWDLWCASPS